MEPIKGSVTPLVQRSKKTALLLSLLVLPGSGHWYLGHRRTGSFIAALATLSLLYPLARFILSIGENFEAMVIADPMTLPQIAPVLQQAWQHEGSLVLAGISISLLCWIGAALSLWRMETP